MDEFPIMWKLSLPTTLGGLIIPAVLWFGNTILIKSPAGYDAMAVYDVLCQWKIAALFVPNILGRIALPMLSNLNVSDDKTDYFKIVKINLWLNGLAALVVALVLSLFSKLILSTYGVGFSSYVVPFVIIMAATVFSAVTAVVYQVILSKNKAWFSCGFSLLWSAVFLTLVYYFVYLQNFGVLGMSISFLISSVFDSILQYCFLWYLVKKEDRHDS
jgi:O-antigen/teichoic acid export membrane protein